MLGNSHQLPHHAHTPFSLAVRSAVYHWARGFARGIVLWAGGPRGGSAAPPVTAAGGVRGSSPG